MKREHKVGIIGTGEIAQTHAQAIARLDMCCMFAAADINQNTLESFCQRYGVEFRSHSARAVIDHPEVDIVIIGTPPALHEEFVLAALDAGKYVVCEKPLAASLEAADRIIARAEETPNRLTVGHQLRYDDTFRRVRWLCQNSHLGQLQYGRVQRHGSIPHQHATNQSWWGNWKIAGGGVVITQLIHELDLLLQIFGTPRSVNAAMATRFTSIESEDDFSGTIMFDSGAVVTVKASVNSGMTDGCFEVGGDAGKLELPWKLTMSNRQDILRTVKLLNQALPETRPPSTSLAARAFSKAADRLGVKKSHQAVSAHERYYSQLLAAIERQQPLPVSPQEARKPLELCMALYESAITGTSVDLPLTPDAGVYQGITAEMFASRCYTSTSRAIAATAEDDPIAREPAIARGGDHVAGPISRPLRIGLLGTDTSHAPTFTQILNDPHHPEHFPGAAVVAAYPGGSADMEISISRVNGFAELLQREYAVDIYSDPISVAEQSDIVLITAADGREHRRLFEAICHLGKPTFIDKPFCTSSDDAEAIFARAAETNCRLMASSAFRYADPFVSVANQLKQSNERIVDCELHGSLPIEPTQGRYFWYGIHTVEMLVALLGPGATGVHCKSYAFHDELQVRWPEGICAKVYGHRTDEQAFWVAVKTERRQVKVDLTPSLATLAPRLLWSIIDILAEGNAPRLWRASPAGTASGDRPSRILDPRPAETLEVVRILEAADSSYQSGEARCLSSWRNKSAA